MYAYFIPTSKADLFGPGSLDPFGPRGHSWDTYWDTTCGYVIATGRTGDAEAVVLTGMLECIRMSPPLHELKVANPLYDEGTAGDRPTNRNRHGVGEGECQHNSGAHL
jgi:hypothetical protein